MLLAVSYSGGTGQAIGSLVATSDSQVYTLTSDHPDFNDILELLKAGRNDEAELRLDRATAVRTAVEDSRFNIEGNVVTFDNRALPDIMAQYIIRLNTEGFDLKPLEKFTDNLFQNPSFRAINEAWRFIEANEMPITEDGCFIGYRAVTPEYKDIRTETFDNSVGSVCEEPRNMVDENPDVTCSHGLHVCSLPYINGPGAGYGRSDSPWIIVKVNPRDVVAVPRDYKNTKLRCCRFEVVGELDRSKIAPKARKSYVEDKAVYTPTSTAKPSGPTDQELIAEGKFYELGQKHRARNDARWGGNPLSSLSFDTGSSYELYMAGYDGRQRPTAAPVARATPAAVPGTNAGEARRMFNEGRYTDLIRFKKEKRVGFSRLGFTAAEEALIEQNRNQNGVVAAPAAVHTDSLGYVVPEALRFDSHGYDQFGFRRSGKNRKGQTRGDLGFAKAGTTLAVAPNARTPVPTPVQTQTVGHVFSSSQYQQGYADGQAATSFLPLSTGADYWNGFTNAWRKNPNNTNR